jgi:hypothetical protein
MAPRLNKRQQRELEELEALGGPHEAPRSSDEELTKPAVQSHTGPGFTAVSLLRRTMLGLEIQVSHNYKLFSPEEDDHESADEASLMANKPRKVSALFINQCDLNSHRLQVEEEEEEEEDSRRV